MAKKWKANQAEIQKGPAFLKRHAWSIAVLVVVAGIVAIAWYSTQMMDKKSKDLATDYEQAMADCMRDRTLHSTSDYAVREAADACVKQLGDAVDREERAAKAAQAAKK
jgi:hypothetical protein